MLENGLLYKPCSSTVVIGPLQFGDLIYTILWISISEKIKVSHIRHAGAKGKKVKLLLIIDLGTRWTRFIAGKRIPGTHGIGGLMGLRPGQDKGAKENYI
jgi:hypothetical protein